MAAPAPNLGQLIQVFLQRPELFAPALGKGNAAKQASNAAYLAYAPQLQALGTLLAQSQGSLRLGSQSAQRAGLAGAQGISAIRNQFNQGAGDRVQSLSGTLASSPESRAAQELNLSKDAVSGMLAQQSAGQIAGINNQQAQLQRQSTIEQGQIGNQLQGLLGQSRAMNAQQLARLGWQQAMLKSRMSIAKERSNATLLSHGIDPATGQPAPNIFPKLHPGKTPKAPSADAIYKQQHGGLTPGEVASRQEKYGAVRDTISGISSDLPNLAGVKVHVNKSTGAVVSPDSNGNYPSGTTTRALTQAEITQAVQKKYGKTATPIIISAANELAHGGLTPQTVRQLQQRYPRFGVPSSWLPKAPKVTVAPSGSLGHGPRPG